MKNKFNRLIVCLYVAIVILSLFVCILIDKTGDSGFKYALPLCFVSLVITMIAFCFSTKPSVSLVESVSEDSYAVINKDVYAIEVDKENKNDVTIKLTRKK